jgi:hypothetical protein
MLFGENTIAMHQVTAAKRLEKAQEKLQHHEAEVRAKHTAKTDEMYEDDED